MTIHERGVNQYNLDTLQAISRDLSHNPKSNRSGTWENLRLAAIKKEIKKRQKP